MLSHFYLRIQLSKYFSRLDNLSELYIAGKNDLFLREMKIFLSDLHSIPALTQNNDVNIIYSEHADLLQKAEQSTGVNELNNIRSFLDKIYIAAFPPKRYKSGKIAGAIAVLFLLVAVLYSPLKNAYHKEKEEANLAANQEKYKQQTMADMLALKAALQKYYEVNKSYPKSSGGFDGVLTSFGESKADWIPGLAPGYIKKLPSDPRNSKDPSAQYYYKSDGVDFKLIAHSALGLDEVTKNTPELVDPRRPSWAYGSWSEGAKDW